MGESRDSEARKKLKRWEKPVLRKIEVTDEERAALLASEDPMALLVRLKPDLGRQGGTDR